MTSSHTSKIPYLSSNARNPLRYPFGGGNIPFVPVTVSMNMAAILSGPSYDDFF